MKYLLLIGIVFAVIWWLKLSRVTHNHDAASPADPQPQPMVRCVHCGLHLPENEAIHARLGFYCSPAHRELHESSST